MALPKMKARKTSKKTTKTKYKAARKKPRKRADSTKESNVTNETDTPVNKPESLGKPSETVGQSNQTPHLEVDQNEAAGPRQDSTLRELEKEENRERTEPVETEVSSVKVPSPQCGSTETALNKAGNRRGMHLKRGEAQEIRKKRTFYGKAVPPIQCNGCSYSTACPQYKPDMECAFMAVLKGKTIRSPEDINDLMTALTEADVQRAQLGLVQERLSGGMLDKQVSSAVDGAFAKLRELKEMQLKALQGNTDSLTLTARGGIVAQLFSNLGRQKEVKPVTEVIQTPRAKMIEEKEKAEREATQEKGKEVDEIISSLP